VLLPLLLNILVRVSERYVIKNGERHKKVLELVFVKLRAISEIFAPQLRAWLSLTC